MEDLTRLRETIDNNVCLSGINHSILCLPCIIEALRLYFISWRNPISFPLVNLLFYPCSFELRYNSPLADIRHQISYTHKIDQDDIYIASALRSKCLEFLFAVQSKMDVCGFTTASVACVVNACKNFDIFNETMFFFPATVQSVSSPLQSLQQRTWLIHWSLFVFFNHPKGRDNIIELFLYQPQ